MPKVEVLDLITVSQSFPDLQPEQLVNRDYLLDAVESIFEGDTQIVVVEGAEGIGKTTFLAQFALRHPDRAVSLFIHPTSRWGYDIELIRFDLCNQLQWLLRQQELNPEHPEHASDAVLRSQLSQVRRRASRQNLSFFFIIDGADSIPEDEQHVRRTILDMLPLGMPSLKFLFGGSYDTFKNEIKKVHIKPYQLPSFSPDETTRFLSEFQLDDKTVIEIHKTFGGIPIRLATVKRLLLTKSVANVEELLNATSGAASLLDVEWNSAAVNESSKLALSIVTFSRTIHTVQDLATLVGISDSELATTLTELSFLQVNTDTHEVSFVSDLLRKYAISKLKHQEKHVYKLLIDRLLESSDSYAARSHLPIYMQRAGRQEQLLDYLSPDYFEETLTHTQSYSPVQTQARIGLEAALGLGRMPEALRFALHRAVLFELSSVNVWESEIRARMALGDYDSAIALAQSAVLKEDRLHLLAIIIKEQRDREIEPAPEIVDQIKHLVDQLDEVDLGERAIEIASDLLSVDPALAFQLLDRVDESSIDHNALDWAYLRLSLVAAAKDGQENNDPKASESLVSKISDPMTRGIAIAAALLVKNYPAPAVIDEAAKLDSVSQQLVLLRSWLLKNRERPDAILVIEYALNLLIRTTEYSPSTRDYREIASPLPHIEDKAKAVALVHKFDGQRGALEHLGPTADYVRLQLILAETEIRHNLDAARSRLTDVYIYVCEIEDLTVRAECIARLVAALSRIDPDNRIQMALRENSEADLALASSRLLEETAHHDLTIIGTIKALARYRFKDALHLVLSLNIESRRDQALEELIDTVIGLPLDKIHFSDLKSGLDHFSDKSNKDAVLLQILAKIDSESEDLPTQQLELVLPLIQMSETILSPVRRCLASCMGANILARHGANSYEPFIAHLMQLVRNSWSGIDRDWEKVDIGFQVASMFAKHNTKAAKDYLDLAEELSNQTRLNSDVVASAYLSCIFLTIRAFRGLLVAGIEMTSDFERISDLIEFIPSKCDQCRLWAELVLQYYSASRLENCRKIVSEQLRPLLAQLQEDNIADYQQTIVAVSPALYCVHTPSMHAMLLSLPQPQRDRAYNRIAHFILDKCSTNDPYDPPRDKVYDLGYEELIDLCEILDALDHDASIVLYVEHIANTLKQSRRLSRQQKAEICSHLSRLPDKLPLRRHIQHDGYKLLLQAYLANASNTRETGVWEQILDAASHIPNRSDQSFVLAHLAVLLPGKQVETKRQISQKAHELTDHIPSLIEKVERNVDLASAFRSTELQLAREYLLGAMKASLVTQDIDAASIQRRIIDVAHSMDQEFAASLASLLDDDPARKSSNKRVKKQLEVLALKSKLANQVEVQPDSKRDYVRVAWDLLGSLNGGQITHRHFSKFAPDLQIAADLPISNSYPIYAFMIENIVRRFSDTNQASSVLRPVFSSVLLTTEVARRSCKPSNDGMVQSRLLAASFYGNKAASMLIHPGQRDKAMKWLRSWLEENLCEYLLICDQFFGPKELDLLQMIQSVMPDCRVQVLTSWKHQINEGIPEPWDEYYREFWRNNISSDQNPPDTDIVVVGIDEKTRRSPIHDRWWLSNGAGIRFGTSYNSLGLDLNSEISVLSASDAADKQEEVNRYLSRRVREVNGKRLLYRIITL